MYLCIQNLQHHRVKLQHTTILRITWTAVPAYPENIAEHQRILRTAVPACQSIPVHSCISSHIVYSHMLHLCVFHAIMSSEPAAHTVWNCRCIRHFTLNTNSYQSNICVWLFYTLHFKFICVWLLLYLTLQHLKSICVWLFYTLHFISNCVFTHQVANTIVSLHIIWIQLCLHAHNPSLIEQSERVVTLKCVLHVFSKLSNHYCGSEVRKRQRTLLFRLSRRRRQEQHDFAFASCISQIGFMYQSNISGTSWRSSLWTSLTHLAMAKQPDVQLEGMSLKHDHPYNVPSIPCY